MVFASDLERRHDVLDHPREGWRVGHELAIEVDADHAASTGQRPDLVVGEVAWVIAQCPTARVSRDIRPGGELVYVPEARLGQMADVDHQSEPFHLSDSGDTELGQTGLRGPLVRAVGEHGPPVPGERSHPDTEPVQSP